MIFRKSPQAPTPEQVSASLNKVRDPKSGRGVMDAGLVQGLHVADGRVRFVLDVPAGMAEFYESVRTACDRAVKDVTGITQVTAVLTAERATAKAMQATPSAQSVSTPTVSIPGVKHILAVASGKGGVGKSTVAVNLALGLRRLGLRVGLLDADIYGPSVPTLLGLSGQPASRDGKIIEPMERHGLKAMSVGLLIAREAAAVWRGPVATGTLFQLLTQVAWGELDVLVIDMPPGTGDIHLSLAQRVAMAGAVIVSTPQDIALMDARRGIAMFRKVNVPILGVVENMSLYVCPNCGHEAHLFGHGGARAAASEIGAPFLGEIPLHLSIREGSDNGMPVMVASPDSPQAQAFMGIAEKVASTLADGVASKPPPRIVMMD